MKIHKLLAGTVTFSICLMAVVTMHASTASAANLTWTGGSSNSFNDASNWFPNQLPNGPQDGDSVNFDNNCIYGVQVPFTIQLSQITFQGTQPGNSRCSLVGTNDVIINNIVDASTTPSGNLINFPIQMNGNGQILGDSGSQLYIGDPQNIGSSALQLVGNITLDLRSTTLSHGVIGGSSAVLNIVGPGTVSLLANSPNFTGTINQQSGTLELGGNFSNASLNVQTGTLKGSGTAGATTVTTGATLAPGNSPGCINTGNLSLVGSSTYSVEIAGRNACTQYDRTNVTGTVTISNNATLTTAFISGFTPTAGDVFQIINNDGNDPVTGHFSGLTEGATFPVGSTTFQISYVGGDGNDVTLAVYSPSQGGNGQTGSGSQGAITPGTPNTGFRLLFANPIVPLVVSLLTSSGLFYIAKNYQTIPARFRQK